MRSFSDFIETEIGKELISYLRECIEFNRDLLEGVQRISQEESDDKLRGRNAQCRDILSYIETRALER